VLQLAEYMMSASPQKDLDVEPGAQSPDDTDAPMDKEAQDQQAQGTGYEFEVKEQDRWLPIANGWSSLYLFG
jgi:nuclear transcription Y subunit beta